MAGTGESQRSYSSDSNARANKYAHPNEDGTGASLFCRSDDRTRRAGDSDSSGSSVGRCSNAEGISWR